MFLEWRHRKRYGGSHQDYLDEPDRHIVWFHKFELMYGDEV